ncbi:MAG TPA: 23S rRNA (adenine(2503)-C(2))-methyltransferase RlmN [Terriglobales bacterium]|nr:23S rRNA (adenine(2503)-C(2))-methyltransferase RlmN [Terriglobales bacterium]
MSIVSPIDIGDLTLEELRAELEAMGERPFRAAQVFEGLYREGLTDFAAFSTLSKALREKLAARFSIGRLELEARLESRDGTAKLVFRLRDGDCVEAVLIPAGRRATACLSTQAGCKFGCAFCASGMHGFRRNLAPSEITGQALYLTKTLGAEVTNYVFMGMGEPLDNFDSLARAIRIMNAPEGMGIAARRMTVSTAGLVPGIERLKGLDLQVNLSVSLHAVTDRLRSRLMPINRTYPLAELVAACEDYVRSGGRMITLEYILIRGTNDGPADADGLAGIARRLRAKVNLIAYSPVAGLTFETPSEGDVARFRRRLEERRVRVTVRLSKGQDILAACGQLAGRFRDRDRPAGAER